MEERYRRGCEAVKRAILFLLILIMCLLDAAADPFSTHVSAVILDAGHGGKDPGASANGLEEKELTLEIVMKLKEEFEDRGYEVILTRSDDSYLELGERSDIANSADCDISGFPVFISIHINSAASASASGFEVYVKRSDHDVAMLSPSSGDKLMLKYAGYDNASLNYFLNRVNLRLASLICSGFSEEFPSLSMRGVKSEDFYVLNTAWMPAVLVEVLFISNRDDARMMADDGFQRSLASVIADAVDNL